METKNKKKIEVITLSDSEGDGDSGIGSGKPNISKLDMEIMFKKMKMVYRKIKKIKKQSLEGQKKISSHKSDKDSKTKNDFQKGTNNQAEKENRYHEPCQKFIDETKSNYWKLGDNKYVSVRNFKGNLFVDLREFFLDEWVKEMVPSKNGIYLNMKIWTALYKVIDKINNCIGSFMNSTEDYQSSISSKKHLEIMQEYLGDNRYATVYELDKRLYVDVRQFYFNDFTQEVIFCRNGIELNYENWRALYRVHKQVNRCLNDKWEKICQDYLQNKWCL